MIAVRNGQVAEGDKKRKDAAGRGPGHPMFDEHADKPQLPVGGEPEAPSASGGMQGKGLSALPGGGPGTPQMKLVVENGQLASMKPWMSHFEKKGSLHGAPVAPSNKTNQRQITIGGQVAYGPDIPGMPESFKNEQEFQDWYSQYRQ